jgi:type IV secretory pathway VirB4 component
VDLLAGGAELCWDPFDAYAAGAVTNPNCWVLGEPGFGKSALIKCLLWRMAAIYGTGTGGRWLAIADPKAEYALLAEYLGLTVIRLTPGGATSVNPLAPGPAAGHEPAEVQVLRHAEMVAALVATVLGRPLTQLEDAAVFAALEDLARQTRRREATLRDVAALLLAPSDAMVARLRRSRDDLGGDLAQVIYALDNLLTRSLRGMFDGPTSVPLRWDGPGLVLDLSAVPLESAALPLVMVAAAGWLQQLMACPGSQRVQVLDEAWAFLKTRHTASWLQSCFKLGRSYGTANICLSHRVSDLAAQADDGTATAKIGKGLIADSATKIILRQAPDQIATTIEHAGLSDPQAQVVGQLARGRALWKVGQHTTLVEHIVAGRHEVALCDTDQRMRANPASTGLDATEPLDANSGVAAIRAHMLRSAEAGEGHKYPALTARGLEEGQDRSRRGWRSPNVGPCPISIDEAVDQSQCTAPAGACL